MKRLFLAYDDKDFAEWIEEELTEYGRFVRSIDGLDFFFPQWNAVVSADVIILPETVIKSQESFLNLYHTVKTESPETVFLLIYHREKDSFIEQLTAEGNVCVHYDELDTGLLEERLRGKKPLITASTPVVAETPDDEVSEVPARRVLEEVQDSLSSEPPGMTTVEREAPRALAEVELAKSENIQTSNEVTGSSNLDEAAEKIAKIEVIPDLASQATQTRQVDLANQVRVETDPIEKQSEKVMHEDSLVETGSSLAVEIREKPKIDAPKLKKRRSPEEQKAKLQKIKERIVIEEKIITVHVPIHVSSKLISVVSLYPRAGATFVTSNFARMLGENKIPVGVLEPVSPSMGSTYYELMHGEKRAPKEWRAWAQQIKQNGHVSPMYDWVDHGVTWMPSTIEPMSRWSEKDLMALLMAARKLPIVLCDISSNYQDDLNQMILSVSDEIWIVADGDPIQLNHYFKQVDSFMTKYPEKPLRIIANKWNSFIKDNEWKEAMAHSPTAHIPELGPEVIKQLWAGKMAWDDSKLKNVLSKSFKPLAKNILPKQFYGLLKQQYGIGARLSHIFKQMQSLEDEKNPAKML
ncbi:hypothetical protein ACLBWT_18655 [Paenibacillus sp. D51F]